MNNYWIIPLLSCLIGWITNKIAIKMLFYPKKPFLGIQGLIPKRQKVIAKKIGEVVEKELLNVDDLINEINKEQFFSLISNNIDKIIDNNLPLLKLLIDDEIIDKYKAKISYSIMSSLKQENFSEVISISDFIEKKINSFDLTKMENIIVDVAKKEFLAIEICGAILGLLIGLLQLLFMM